MLVCVFPLLAGWAAELEHFSAETLCVVEMQIQSSLMTQTIKQQRELRISICRSHLKIMLRCAMLITFLFSSYTLYFLFILFSRGVSSLPVV